MRRISPSQLRSLLRQAEQKQRRAINSYNQAARRFNREIDNFNRKLKRAVDDYNREARAHNARVRTNRQRLQKELARLAAQPTSTRYVTYRASTQVLQQALVGGDQGPNERMG